MSSDEICSEIILLPLKPDADFNNDNDAMGKEWVEARRILRSQPGMLDQWYGMVEEKPHVGILLKNWTSLSAHQSYEATPDHNTFKQQISKILSAPAAPFHVYFNINALPEKPIRSYTQLYNPSSAAKQTNQSATFEAALTEIILLFNPSSSISLPVDSLISILSEYASGFVSATHGEVVEQRDIKLYQDPAVNKPPGQKREEGKSVKGYFVAVGWTSKEAADAARGLAHVQKAVGEIKGQVEGLEIVHVALKKDVKS